MLKENMPEYDERDEMSEQRAVVNNRKFFFKSKDKTKILLLKQ